VRGWPLVFQILGASAALISFVVFIGGVVMWIRFNAIDLPADQAIALLPRSILLTTGAHSLAAPILIGLAVVLLIYLINPLDPADDKPTTQLYVAVAVLFLISLFVAIREVGDYTLIPDQLIMYGALVVAAGLVLGIAHRTRGFAPLGWIVFSAFTLLGGVLALVTTAAEPRLEPAAAIFKAAEQTGRAMEESPAGPGAAAKRREPVRVEGISGFLIGQTGDKLYLAPLPGSGDLADPFADADLDRIVEVPRETIVRLAIREPVGVHADEGGREQAQSLLQDLRVQLAASEPTKTEAVKTDNPVEAFAPLVNLHAGETAWPMNVNTFLARSALLWRHGGGCPAYSFPLGRHISDPGAVAAEIEGKFNQAKLGAGGFAHFASEPGSCRDLLAQDFNSAEKTRPDDPDARPAGLPTDQGFYLDLADSARNGERQVIQEGPQSVFSGTRVYWERHPEPSGGRGAERITYWLFYGLSQPPGQRDVTQKLVHEGDWERVSVVIEPGKKRDHWIPLSARYHFHDEARDVPWAAVRTVSMGPGAATHPIVFSARGSHASFPRAGSYASQLRGLGGNIITVHDDAIACPRCPVWRTWQLLANAQDQPWYGFGGAWGAVGKIRGTSGPLGPSRYKIGGLETPTESAIETVRKDPDKDDEP
jgi:hypothetical protein